VTHPLGRVHIVGIGGAGMSALARLLLAQGAVVTGSDAKDSKRLSALQAEGATTFVGHSADHVVGADTVAASTAVPETNPELTQARELGIRVLTRAELLCSITDNFVVASVAGHHGKTTTTSMLTVILQNAGLDPSFAIGSELNETGSNAHLGSGEVFVVEADESDGTFLQLNTKVAIVTNVEPDHLNYWKTFDAIEDAFVQFATNTSRNDGFTVVCIDDDGGRRLANAARLHGANIKTYGQSDDADYQVRIVDHSARTWNFTIWHDGKEWVKSQVRVPGVHNVLNGTAAIIAAVGLGLEPILAAGGLTHFSGTRRRFDFKGEADGVRVFDDYAHHPTEIAATLRAARDVAGIGNVVVAFQAHHYYRTALFSKEFGEALGLADQVVVLEVFAPGEEFIPGASGQTLANNVPLSAENVVFETSWSEVSQHLVDRAEPGDIIMTLGAGEIGLLCSEVVEKLREREKSRG
jgi:UDP-N-acetylmuramate--alanine ligase